MSEVLGKLGGRSKELVFREEGNEGSLEWMQGKQRVNIGLQTPNYFQNQENSSRKNLFLMENPFLYSRSSS